MPVRNALWVLFAGVAMVILQRGRAPEAEWAAYGADVRNTKYSALAGITPENATHRRPQLTRPSHALSQVRPAWMAGSEKRDILLPATTPATRG